MADNIVSRRVLGLVKILQLALSRSLRLVGTEVVLCTTLSDDTREAGRRHSRRVRHG